MLFDKFCGYAEKSNDPQLLRMAREARIFVFPDAPHTFLPQELTTEQSGEIVETFFLPFPVVAVEDTASCVILSDTEEDQQGWEHSRKFVDVRKLFPDPAAFREDEYLEEFKEIGKSLAAGELPLLKDMYLMLFGEIDKLNPVTNTRQYLIHGSVTSCLLVTKTDIKAIPYDNSTIKCGLTAAKTAVEEVLFANTPDRFIVERTNVKVRRHPSSKISRSQDRPQYTLLKPGKIRETMKLPSFESLGIKVTPHAVRRHWRTFRSDKFTHMKGHRIMVAASWHVPSENIVGGHKYRILLDK